MPKTKESIEKQRRLKLKTLGLIERIDDDSFRGDVSKLIGDSWACNRCNAVFYQKNNWITHMKRHGVIVT